MMLHPRHAEWLALRGIGRELSESYGLSTLQTEAGNWLRMPYRDRGIEVNAKLRLTTRKEFRLERKLNEGESLPWWNVDVLDRDEVRDPNSPVVVTEGEIDALSAIQAGHELAISVPAGAAVSKSEGPLLEQSDAKRFGFFWRDRERTDRVATFVIATDADEPGQVLAWELVRRLGAHRCKFIEYPEGCKDLNDVLVRHGSARILELIAKAKSWPVKGLYTIDDFPEPPPIEPIRIRIPSVHDMWPIVPGTVTIITGYAGQGKTSFILACVADLLKQGHVIAMGSFETAVKPILVSLMRGFIGGWRQDLLEPEQIERADNMMRQRLRIISQSPQHENEDFDIGQILDLASIAVLRDSARALILDPWNEIEHRRERDETETEYTGRVIRELKRFARAYGIAVIVVAHPRKPVMSDGKLRPPTLYDIAGSAHFANKADYGISIYRPDKKKPVISFEVNKVRAGMPGRMGSVRLVYDFERCRYEEEVDEDAAHS